MKRTMLTRMLCMILALCTVLTMVPAVVATEVTEPIETGPAETEPVETEPAETEPVETEPVETEPVETEPAETEPVETEPVETEPVETEPVETEPAETEPAETEPVETEPVETEPAETEPVETEPAETEPVETEPVETVPAVEMNAEIPFGLKGMPEEYVFGQEALASKVFLTEHDVLNVLDSMVPGEDYVTNEIVAEAETLEEAEMIAAAYNGQLKTFSDRVATIVLDGLDVRSAVAAAADMCVRLPAVSPNYIVRLEPMEIEEITDTQDPDISAEGVLPQRKDWSSWVKDTMSNPDPYLTSPWNGSSGYQWMHDVVDTYAAWGVTTGYSFVKVAVLDTGVNGNHVELSGRVTHADIGMGTGDDHGHGSHVAGIIAGRMNNGYGGAGIAPYVSILSIKVLDEDGSGSMDGVARAINRAADNGAYIINMSLSSPGPSSVVQSAVNYAHKKNVTVIAAMGNNHSNVKRYPAACSNVIAVVSTDETNSRSPFSNWGSWADVAAPGSNVVSLYYGNNYGMCSMSGTSMATPVVAGLAALYMSNYGRVSPSKMESVLEASCVKGSSELGKGIVNAANMFSKTKPYVTSFVQDESGVTHTGKNVPCNAALILQDNANDESYWTVYTINGKTPSIKNGEVVNGYSCYGGANIDLADYAGKTITVKAIVVNGIGIASAVKTIKLNVSKVPSATGVSVSGPTRLVSGKSATYTATVYPYGASQSVTWSIINRSGMASAKISSSGKLTTSSSQEGWVRIRATAKANTAQYCDYYVYSVKMKPVASMALSQSTATLTLGTGYSRDYRMTLSIAKMVDSSNNPIDPAYSGVKWTSSKSSVATVGQNGVVVALNPGTTTITCKALDGSGKSASCKITVKQRVTDLSISGQDTLAPGASYTYKANCYPSFANNKSVTWSVSNAPAGTKIDSKGKVTLPKSASAYNNSYFYVSATTKDGSALTSTYAVRIRPKCTELNISYYNQDSKLIKNKSNGYVSSAVLYTLDDTYYSGDDTDICLVSWGKTNDPAVKWSSSSPSVATVDQSGYVKAVKAGTAKITATALDGSGKKATITITVRNPVSTMTIKSGIKRNLFVEGQLAYGKSATNSVVFADTYGTVSNKAVDWSFSIYDEDSGYYYTNYFKNQKWVSVSSSGKITTSSKIANFGSQRLRLRLYATSKDNPNISTYYDYYLVPATKKMSAQYTSVTMNTNSSKYIYIYCDKNYYDDPVWYDLSATSSNPNVVGAMSIGLDGYSSNRMYYVLELYGGTKRGTATITVKANDGSGKNCKIKVTVR